MFVLGMLRGHWQFLKLKKKDKGTQFWLGSPAEPSLLSSYIIKSLQFFSFVILLLQHSAIFRADNLFPILLCNFFCLFPVFSVCVSTVLVLFLSFHSPLIRCLVAMLYPDSVMYLGQAADISASQYCMSETKKRCCTFVTLWNLEFEV